MQQNSVHAHFTLLIPTALDVQELVPSLEFLSQKEREWVQSVAGDLEAWLRVDLDVRYNNYYIQYYENKHLT